MNKEEKKYHHEILSLSFFCTWLLGFVLIVGLCYLAPKSYTFLLMIVAILHFIMFRIGMRKGSRLYEEEEKENE